MTEPPPPPPPRRRLPGGPWPWSIAGLLVIAAIAVAVVLVVGGDDKADAQTVRFQQPVDVGPDPFIDTPADRKGKQKVKVTPSKVGSGPFGGTGSDLVCDRDLLIRSLKERPDRLAEWARVLGVEPTIKAVGAYIAKLHPVTLTRDTRVTNHSFVNGRAVAFQSILAAGTAVLVDDYGNPVARCRCGNPLLKPLPLPEAVCRGCPPRYEPPPACPYTRRTTYRRRFYPERFYSNAAYDEIFVEEFTSDCYAAYPDPPRVTITTIYSPRLKPRRTATPAPVTTAAPSGDVRVSISPSSVPVCEPYTLSVSGFAANRTLNVSLAVPGAGSTDSTITTNRSGSASLTVPVASKCAQVIQGTYVATVTDPGSGASGSASVTIGEAGAATVEPDTEAPGGGGGVEELHCDPPESQLEAERCAEAGLG